MEQNKNRYAKQTDYEERFWVGMEGRIHEDDGFDRPKTLLYPGDDDYDCQTWQRIDNFVFEQCTGLKGANGKLIFEGDIVKSKSGNVFVVVWDAVKCRWMRKKRSGLWFDLKEEIKQAPLRIIGNIHENPELLEA